MKLRPLRQLTVAGVPLPLEEAVATWIETIFGLLPVIYVDFETGLRSVSVYGEEQLGLSRAFRAELATQLGQLGLKIPPAGIESSVVRRKNWAESWKRHFRPIQIGNRLLIKPSWSRLKPKPKQAVLILDPGLSFGTGKHPTTSFCLRQIVQCRVAGSKQSLLDIGTGSGILALAAVRMGYSRVEALDIDPESIRAARRNASRNRCEKRLHITRADLTRLPGSTTRKFHVVCANLTADLLMEQRARIISRVRPGGKLLLAGILASESERVRVVYQALGFRLLRQTEKNEWSSLALVSPEKR